MKKTLAALTLGVGLVLSGCAGWSAPETPEQIVFSAKSTYAGLAATAGVYESLPRCDEVEEKVCSERDIVSAIRKADNAAYSSDCSR